MLLKKLQQKDYTKAQKTHNKEKPPVYAEIEFNYLLPFNQNYTE